MEVGDGISEVVGQKLDSNQIHILFDEFDKDDNGEIDFQEFMVMADYFKTAMSLTVGTKSVSV